MRCGMPEDAAGTAPPNAAPESQNLCIRNVAVEGDGLASPCMFDNIVTHCRCTHYWEKTFMMVMLDEDASRVLARGLPGTCLLCSVAAGTSAVRHVYSAEAVCRRHRRPHQRRAALNGNNPAISIHSGHAATHREARSTAPPAPPPTIYPAALGTHANPDACFHNRRYAPHRILPEGCFPGGAAAKAGLPGERGCRRFMPAAAAQ